MTYQCRELSGKCHAQQKLLVILLRAMVQSLPDRAADELIEELWSNWEAWLAGGDDRATEQSASWDYLVHARDAQHVKRQ